MNSILYSAVLATGLLANPGSYSSLPAEIVASSPAIEIATPSPAPLAMLGRGELTITCPETGKGFCGDSTDPSTTGFPTVTGGCDRQPTVTYSDTETTTGCAADRFDHVIHRTWTATDSCGASVSCVQKIDVIKNILFLDMHPRSCPNPVNTNGNGVIPAALLGTATFDVTQIDPGSIELWAAHCNGGPVVPAQFNYEDVATPYMPVTPCGCHTLGADGYMDLTLKFSKQQVVSALNLTSYPQFSMVRLFIVGKLTNGCSFISNDCIRVQ